MGDGPDKPVPQFARLRELRTKMTIEDELELPEIVDGMSGDYEAAIATGATNGADRIEPVFSGCCCRSDGRTTPPARRRLFL